MTETVTEIKTTLAGEEKRFACELLARADAEAVVIYRMPRAVELEDIVLPENAISLGYFWAHKPFNAYHWLDPDGRSLALYFNISDGTRLGEHEIAWRDLAVDVLITPDLRCRVLDEDELPADLDAGLRAYIEAARERLCAAPAQALDAFRARSARLLAEA